MADPVVDFYLTPQTGSSARRQLACRLVQKAYLQGLTSLLLAADSEEARQIDQLLWTFQPGSFIPHAIIQENDGIDEDVTVWIGTDPGPPQLANVLISLTDAVPSIYTGFKRVLDPVSSEDSDKMRARKRFRYYRDQGLEPQFHSLEK